MSGGSSETKSTPSPLDTEKAETAKQLFALLFPQMVPEMAGVMTGNKAKAGQQQFSQSMGSAAGKKIAPGSPAMYSAPTKGGTSNNVLNTALQLYGQAPQMPGSSSTTTTPGAMDYMNSAGNAYLIYKLLGGGGGGGGGVDYTGTSRDTGAGGVFD